MTDLLPKDVLEGLREARKRDARRKARLRVVVGVERFPVLDSWDTGFAMDLDTAPRLRGVVDLYEGSVHLMQCLIVASTEALDAGRMVYEFKRTTPATDTAPVDFARDPEAPVALIAR